MAVEMDPDVTVPQSTGAVKTPTKPIKIVQPASGKAAPDAVMPVSGPVTTEFGPTGQNPTGVIETPGPVTIRNPVAKVVKSPRRAAAEAATTAETEQDAYEQARGRRAYQPDDDGR